MRNNSGKVLKHFDNIFNTNTRNNIKQLPLFRVFYEYFADDFYTTDDDTKELITKRTEISEKLKEQVTEESAYTWFNRIVAIRYMELHDMLPLAKDNQSLKYNLLLIYWRAHQQLL